MSVFNPVILGFDTSAAHCAAALLTRNAVFGERHEDMARGQAERLMTLLEEVLSETGNHWRDLDALAVGIGPGNFTGIRIAVSAARGLSLALGIPALGVSQFEVMRDPAGLSAHPAEIVSLRAPRDMAYVRQYRYGKPQAPGRLIDPSKPPQDLELPVNMRVRGHRATEIAAPFGAEADDAEIEEIGYRVLRCAEWRWLHERERLESPAPLYIRPADAAPPRTQPPQILENGT